MILWLDAHLSPKLADWLSRTFDVEAIPVRDLGLREAKDREIFEAARAADVVVVTKDKDFPELVLRLGPPPRVLWLTIGNTSNRHLQTIFKKNLSQALELFAAREPLVEITA